MTVASTCDEPLRTGACTLRVGHRGRHATVSFCCEACGKTRRGTPTTTQIVRFGEEIDDVFDFCFLCASNLTTK